jgi:hypothetical protein
VVVPVVVPAVVQAVVPVAADLAAVVPAVVAPAVVAPAAVAPAVVAPAAVAPAAVAGQADDYLTCAPSPAQHSRDPSGQQRPTKPPVGRPQARSRGISRLPCAVDQPLSTRRALSRLARPEQFRDRRRWRAVLRRAIGQLIEDAAHADRERLHRALKFSDSLQVLATCGLRVHDRKVLLFGFCQKNFPLEKPADCSYLEGAPIWSSRNGGPEMAMDMLRQLAGSPLPATFRTPAEIDQVKLLRAAGLVIALTPASSNPPTPSGIGDAAQVLAITEKGREELARFSLPGDLPPMPRARAPWWKTMLGARDPSHRDM